MRLVSVPIASGLTLLSTVADSHEGMARVSHSSGVRRPATGGPTGSHGTVPRRPRPAEIGAATASGTDPRKPWQCAALLEITNFAALRRRLGRTRADALVLDVAERARRGVPGVATGIVGRVTIELSCEGETLAEVQTLPERIAELCREPFDLDGEAHLLDIAIGAAAAPLGLIEDVRMIEEAEGALDDARIDHKTVLRDLSRDALAFDRVTLTRELPVALERGELFLQYQPKVHVRKQRIDSAEALIRWQHPRRGLILPGDFITVAEDARQIAALTLWTLDRVIADQADLHADGHDLTIFINISGQLLGDARFVAAACERVRSGGVKIGFEITETAVIRDPQSAIGNLQIFADQGITIAIDDYGAGLSSLAYLKQLPARELKIDKMFVLQLTSSNRDPLIVRSTIDLAHALDMEVTAEGVETQAAMALLSVMGCDMVQGYLISRPVSIDAFRQFLRDAPLTTLDGGRSGMFRPPATFWKSA